MISHLAVFLRTAFMRGLRQYVLAGGTSSPEYRAGLILLACSASGISHGDWTVIGEGESRNRGESRSAVFNSEAHQIQLNHEGQSVWMHITHKGTGTLKQNDPVKMTVDTNPEYILDPGELRAVELLLGKTIFQWQPSTLSFQLWHGSETEGCGYLEQLLQGKALDVHYQLAGEQTGRIVASLKGAREAIVSGLGLKHCGR